MSTPLHIVHTESSCGWGGQEIRILEESRGLQARGHTVTILCPESSQIFARAAQWNVRAIALPIEKKKLSALLSMKRWFEQCSSAPDVVNTHSSTDSWLAAIALRMIKASTPIVRTRDISAPVKPTMANRWLYAKAARYVVTTGEQLRQELVQKLGVSAQRSSSVATGIDTARFIPGDKRTARQLLSLELEGKWIGIVATLRSWKGHRFLLQALHSMPDSSLKLLVVGDGPQREALEQLTRELSLTERVLFVGNQKDVVPWLQALDLFVLPSYANEGVSQAVMQAMAVGLPIITTAVGSMTDVIRHEDTGLIVPAQDIAQLTAAIARLVDDEETAAALGRRAHAFALSNCGLERMLDRMEAIFVGAAAEKYRR